MLKTTKTREVVNYDTGEVHLIETSKFQSEKIKTDQFYSVFFEYMQNYLKIKSAKTLFLIGELCSRAEWNTGKVLLPAGVKKEICTKIGLDYTNISKCLKTLESLDLITKESVGVYYVNPKIFWKGTMADRKKLLGQHCRFNVEFSIESAD